MKARRRNFLRSYHFKRYQARRFRNPYFQHQQKPSAWRARLFFLLGTVLLGALFYLLAFAPFWMINEIKVEGLQYMSSTPVEALVTEQMNRRRWIFFSERHPWFLDDQAITERLYTQYAFETISTVTSGRTLVITLKERVSQIVWFIADQGYFVDLQGVIIRALSADEAEALRLSGPVVEGPFPFQDRLRGLARIINEDGTVPTAGEVVLVTNGVQKIIEMNAALIVNNLTPDHFAVERATAAWARADLREGFSVLFDLTTNVDEQILNLMTVLQQDVKNRETLEYVDVRFGNHVYVQGGE